jgi:hypothetical protein
MQRDGNLVLYVGTDHTPANSKWSSRSNGKGNGPYKCVMQSDGNLVIYTFDNQSIWASNTKGKGRGGHFLII